MTNFPGSTEFDAKAVWQDRYAPGLHPAIDFDYHSLSDNSKPHLQEFVDKNNVKKVLRIESGAFVDLEEAELSANTFSAYLGVLHQNGIATLDPIYSWAEDAKGDPTLYIVVDKIENPIHFTEVLDSMDNHHLLAYDHLAESLVGVIHQSCREGGWIFTDTFRLDQYVINDDNISQTLTLVDVAPEGGAQLPAPTDEVGSSHHRTETLNNALRWITEDVISLDRSLESESNGRMRILNMLDDRAVTNLLESAVVERLRSALELNDSSLVDIDDKDEWWWGRPRY